MKAATIRRYGPPDVLNIEDLPRPEPGPDEILVKVAAAGVTTADWRIRAAAYPAFAPLVRLVLGVFRPKKPVPGSDFAGRVVARGAEVTRFALGDAVFGYVFFGAHAEYLVAPAEGPVARLPRGLSMEDAAAIPFGALAALGYLRDIAKLRAGERVLILGASGGVGSHAVQIARAMGAEVTALARAEHHDLVRCLGAQRAIDYRTTDFTAAPERYDVILDTAGISSWRKARRALAAGGRYAPMEFGMRDVLRAMLRRRGRRMVLGVTGETRDDMEHLAALAGTGALRPVIDSRFELAGIAAAHARVESRHKAGAVVLRIDPGLTPPAA